MCVCFKLKHKWNRMKLYGNSWNLIKHIRSTRVQWWPRIIKVTVTTHKGSCTYVITDNTSVNCITCCVIDISIITMIKRSLFLENSVRNADKRQRCNTKPRLRICAMNTRKERRIHAWTSSTVFFEIVFEERSISYLIKVVSLLFFRVRTVRKNFLPPNLNEAIFRVKYD